MYLNSHLCFLNRWTILTSYDSYKAWLFPARIESLWLTWGLTCVQPGCHSTFKDASSSLCLVLRYLFNSQHLSLPISPLPSWFAPLFVSAVCHPKTLYRCMSMRALISPSWESSSPKRTSLFMTSVITSLCRVDNRELLYSQVSCERCITPVKSVNTRVFIGFSRVTSVLVAGGREDCSAQIFAESTSGHLAELWLNPYHSEVED